jgi:hypothetical protein
VNRTSQIDIFTVKCIAGGLKISQSILNPPSQIAIGLVKSLFRSLGNKPLNSEPLSNPDSPPQNSRLFARK